jgi:hypothetical protein
MLLKYRFKVGTSKSRDGVKNLAKEIRYSRGSHSNKLKENNYTYLILAFFAYLSNS